MFKFFDSNMACFSCGIFFDLVQKNILRVLEWFPPGPCQSLLVRPSLMSEVPLFKHTFTDSHSNADAVREALETAGDSSCLRGAQVQSEQVKNLGMQLPSCYFISCHVKHAR